MRTCAAADFDELTAGLLEELVPQLRGRYALFGHGIGGLIAHRLALTLQLRGGSLPSDLFVSACAAPSCRQRRCFALADEDQSMVAALHLAASSAAASRVDRFLLQTTFDEINGCHRAARCTLDQPAEPLRVPVHVFAGRKDGIDIGSLEAWVQETSAGFALDWYDGGYFYIREHHDALFEAMLRDLSQGFRDPAMV